MHPWKGDIYDGEWKGDIYDGEWKGGKQNGKGIYYFANGDRYDGEWKDGKKMANDFAITRILNILLNYFFCFEF